MQKRNIRNEEMMIIVLNIYIYILSFSNLNFHDLMMYAPVSYFSFGSVGINAACATKNFRWVLTASDETPNVRSFDMNRTVSGAIQLSQNQRHGLPETVTKVCNNILYA